MAACPAFHYTHVTPTVFRNLQAIGRKRGITVPNAPSGKIAISAGGSKVQFQYAWDSGSGRLQLTCVAKPLLASCSMIRSVADSIVKESGGRPG